MTVVRLVANRTFFKDEAVLRDEIVDMFDSDLVWPNFESLRIALSKEEYDFSEGFNLAFFWTSVFSFNEMYTLISGRRSVLDFSINNQRK